MANLLSWDNDGERFYETGVKNAVLYVKDTTGKYGAGVAWNGVTGITESPSGAEATALYADDIKYLNLISAEEYGITITAYQSPEEFDICDGAAELVKGVVVSQQTRRGFGICYRTAIGNDVEADMYGYKLHIVYGCIAAPSERSYSTINDSPEAMELSWEVNTTPVNVPGHKPTAHLTIDSTKIDAEKLTKLEEVLYGKAATSDDAGDEVAARLPLPAEIMTILAA